MNEEDTKGILELLKFLSPSRMAYNDCEKKIFKRHPEWKHPKDKFKAGVRFINEPIYGGFYGIVYRIHHHSKIETIEKSFALIENHWTRNGFLTEEEALNAAKEWIASNAS